ncbi:MAG: 50S ribosomal protein L11 methyltransferase, partial [Bacilli bacterium]
VYGEIWDLNANDFPTEGVRLKAYFPMEEDFDQQMQALHQAILDLAQYDIPLEPSAWSIAEVNEEDWANAWKKYYHPIQVTERLTIVPSWETYERKTEEEMLLTLDPGMAFGTGSHPTTYMCIEALEQYVKQGDTVIDVGTGSGVLAIAAAFYGATKIYASDLDPVAVESAQENVDRNGVADVVEVTQRNLLDEQNVKVEVVVANILAEVILTFVDEVYATLLPNGVFISSGIIGSKRAMVETRLLEAGFTIDTVYEQKDWVAIVARKGA